MPTNAIDAPHAAALPIQVGAAVTTYPFRENGDLATRVTTRPYKQAAAHFAPALYGTADPADPSAYLIEESDPTPSLIPSLLRFTRAYATIPLAQVIPTTRLFDRPNLHDLKSGSTYAVSFDDGLTSCLLASRQSATIGAITEPTTPIATAAESRVELSGTWTVTVTGSTAGSSSFTQGSSASSIRSAFTNRGATTCTVNKSDFAIAITYDTANIYTVDITLGASNIAIEGSAGSITIVPATLKEASSSSLTETPNTAQSTRSVSCTGHGGSAGTRVALWNGDTLVATTKLISATTDAFVLPADEGPLAIGALAISHIQFEDNGTTIANGPIRCSAKRTQTFYLPGVTPGITTAADIAPPTVVTDPQGWLDTVVAYLASPSNTTYAVHEVSDLQPWRGTIVMQEVLSLQLADAVRTV